jgi:hypothetical protein
LEIGWPLRLTREIVIASRASSFVKLELRFVASGSGVHRILRTEHDADELLVVKNSILVLVVRVEHAHEVVAIIQMNAHFLHCSLELVGVKDSIPVEIKELECFEQHLLFRLSPSGFLLELELEFSLETF